MFDPRVLEKLDGHPNHSYTRLFPIRSGLPGDLFISRMFASMKSEERQQLETNQLGQVVQAAGQRFEDNMTKIVAVVCAVLLLGAGITWWSRQSSSSTQAAWTLLENADTIEKYADIREKYRGTVAARWAQLLESEQYLKNGLDQMFTNRELGTSDLKKAISGFEELHTTKSEVALHERTLWGLALALEATSDGDTTKASEAYQKLLNDVPDTMYKLVAEQRITALKTGGAKDFYAWFSKQNPKPADLRPLDGALKGDLDSLIPSPSSEFNLKPDAPKGDAVKDDKPKTDETKPAAEGDKTDAKPDAAAPKEEPKAEDKKPEEKKADETPAEKAEEPKTEKKE